MPMPTEVCTGWLTGTKARSNGGQRRDGAEGAGRRSLKGRGGRFSQRRAGLAPLALDRDPILRCEECRVRYWRNVSGRRRLGRWARSEEQGCAGMQNSQGRRTRRTCAAASSRSVLPRRPPDGHRRFLSAPDVLYIRKRGRRFRGCSDFGVDEMPRPSGCATGDGVPQGWRRAQKGSEGPRSLARDCGEYMRDGASLHLAGQRDRCDPLASNAPSIRAVAAMHRTRDPEFGPTPASPRRSCQPQSSAALDSALPSTLLGSQLARSKTWAEICTNIAPAACREPVRMSSL